MRATSAKKNTASLLPGCLFVLEAIGSHSPGWGSP